MHNSGGKTLVQWRLSASSFSLHALKEAKTTSARQGRANRSVEGKLQSGVTRPVAPWAQKRIAAEEAAWDPMVSAVNRANGKHVRAICSTRPPLQQPAIEDAIIANSEAGCLSG